MKTMLMGLAIASAQALTLAPATAAPAARPQPVPCSAAGLPADARCGILRVPEDRRKASGRTVPIHYAIVPGQGEARPVPIFFLAGGPGQSATETAPTILAELKNVKAQSDIVLIDQRGTGQSSPLRCPDGFGLLAEGSDADIRSCIDRLSASADLRRYLTEDAVQDLEAVRSALGYPSITIAAASYGVRPALAYMRSHPQRVRSALLRAASAPDFNIIRDGLGNAEAELERVMAGCERDADCRAAFPSLRDQLKRLETTLAATPERVKNGDGEIKVTPELLHQTLYAMMLSAPTRQQIPFLISTAESRGFAPLAPLLSSVNKALYDALPIGMYLSVLCSEDAPRLSSRDVMRQANGLGQLAARLHHVCQSWPRRPVPAALFKPLRSDVPTLILSGDVDPAMPEASAEKLNTMLRKSRHIVLSGAAHGPLFPECVRDSVADFLRTATLPPASTACNGTRLPPFRTR